MAKRLDKKKEAARIVRQQREQEERRRKLILTSIILGGVLALVVVIGFGLYLNQKDDVVQPKAAHTDTGAVIIGDGPVTVDLYEDFMCPICKMLDTQIRTQLNEKVDAGQVTVNFHPIAILDGASQGTMYSTRSASAAVCAADDDKFTEYAGLLFDNQPAEQTEGLTDKELIALGEGIGLGTSFKSCVEKSTYHGWVQESTEIASDAGVSATPTVFVNGEKIEVPQDATIEDVGNKFLETLDAAIAEAGVDEPSPSTGESASDQPTEEATKEDTESSDGN